MLFFKEVVPIDKDKYIRVNQAIRAPLVRLISETGEMLGIKPLQEALRISEQRGFDLIEIAPNSNPPVCKLGNYSKFLYQREKRSKDSRKKKAGGQVKEVRIRPKIGEHDFLVKIAMIERFLKEKNKVRLSMVFFGREFEHQELGYKMLDRIMEKVSSLGSLEQKPQLYGNRLISIIAPIKG